LRATRNVATVLIVDDSPLDRRIAGECVKQESLTAAYAENGGDALAQVARARPDIVLTDLQMPEMDGLELVREMKRTYPAVPVILMTAHGSEEIAVTALKSGATSYIPKKNLKQDLGDTLRMALDVARFRRDRELVLDILSHAESYFVLGYQPNAARALIGHLQDGLRQMGLCDDTDLNRIGTALSEALINAIEHGNLELDSALREAADGSYYRLGKERSDQEPYRDRRVHVTARLTPAEAIFTVRDEGPGFDPSRLPDPTDPTNLARLSGRGLLLIRTFMDEVRFNETGNQLTMVKRAAERSA
jgi:CheY-like chemotaxis protein